MVVAVLCRMTFDFALWSEGKVPVTLVCEEAHRYVPANPHLGFEPCKRAIASIAKEGRKYGASLCIVTQRPAEIDPTILSQCNTVFALRMSNDRDQAIVSSAISDTGSGLLEFLSALGQREAIAFGDGVTLPVRIRFDDLPQHAMPRSSTARFSEMWQRSTGDDLLLEHIVEKWRTVGQRRRHCKRRCSPRRWRLRAPPRKRGIRRMVLSRVTPTKHSMWKTRSWGSARRCRSTVPPRREPAPAAPRCACIARGIHTTAEPARRGPAVPAGTAVVSAPAVTLIGPVVPASRIKHGTVAALDLANGRATIRRLQLSIRPQAPMGPTVFSKT